MWEIVGSINKPLGFNENCENKLLWPVCLTAQKTLIMRQRDLSYIGGNKRKRAVYISCVKQLGERGRLATRAPPPSGRLSSARLGVGMGLGLGLGLGLDLGSWWKASGPIRFF